MSKIFLCMANSVDPDQTPHNAASDQGLHCLQRPICPKLIIIMVASDKRNIKKIIYFISL